LSRYLGLQSIASVSAFCMLADLVPGRSISAEAQGSASNVSLPLCALVYRLQPCMKGLVGFSRFSLRPVHR